jgi:hypothetical protein
MRKISFKTTRTEKPLPIVDCIKKEFSFFKGNHAVIVLSWILIDFAFELPATYYALYVLELGATETIIGMIGLALFLAMAFIQFP